MNAKSFSQWLNGFSLPERARVLNRIAFDLTIQARKYYGAPSRETKAPLHDGHELVAINEVQHKLLSQGGHYLDGEQDKVYPVDVFSEIVFQTAEHYGITPDLSTAIRFAQQKIPKPGSEAGGQNSKSTADPW